MLPSNPQQVPVQLSQLSPFHTSTLKGQISGPIHHKHSQHPRSTSRNSIAHPVPWRHTIPILKAPLGAFPEDLRDSFCSIHISIWLWVENWIPKQESSVLIQLPSLHFSCCRLNQSRDVQGALEPGSTSWLSPTEVTTALAQSVDPWLYSAAGESEVSGCPSPWCIYLLNNHWVTPIVGIKNNQHVKHTQKMATIGNWCQTHSSAGPQLGSLPVQHTNQSPDLKMLLPSRLQHHDQSQSWLMTHDSVLFVKSGCWCFGNISWWWYDGVI